MENIRGLVSWAGMGRSDPGTDYVYLLQNCCVLRLHVIR